MESSQSSLCGNLGHRSQKTVLGTSLSGFNPAPDNLSVGSILVRSLGNMDNHILVLHREWCNTG